MYSNLVSSKIKIIYRLKILVLSVKLDSIDLFNREKIGVGADKKGRNVVELAAGRIGHRFRMKRNRGRGRSLWGIECGEQRVTRMKRKGYSIFWVVHAPVIANFNF